MQLLMIILPQELVIDSFRINTLVTIIIMNLLVNGCAHHVAQTLESLETIKALKMALGNLHFFLITHYIKNISNFVNSFM